MLSNIDKMNVIPKKINRFLLFKLPLAFIAGVRVKAITEKEAIATITHKWMNQNPYRSMFWAAQGMAAELTTGVLVMRAIEVSGVKVSMLVTNQKATFTKKATGKITFVCKNNGFISEAISTSLKTGEGQTFKLISEGTNEDGIVVSNFEFEWSLKVKG